MIISYVAPHIELFGDIDERGIIVNDFDPSIDQTPYIDYRNDLARLTGRPINYLSVNTKDEFFEKCYYEVMKHCPSQLKVLGRFMTRYEYV